MRVVDHAEIVPSITVPQIQRFTDKQGQYLAFIYNYTVLNGRPPAEADMERFFCVTAPSVHQMVLGLERTALIRRTPRQARSIELAIDAAEIPQLQPIKTTVVRY